MNQYKNQNQQIQLMLIDAKINLTKIQKDKLFKSEKTGAIYLDVKIAERQAPDNYGNTHTLYIQKAKEDEKIYIGEGKAVQFESAQTRPSSTIGRDDLPF